MNTENAYRTLQTVARIYGITVDEVIQNIDDAIDAGMASSDPIVQARWAQIPRSGDVPSAVELLAYLAEQLANILDPDTAQIS